MLLNGSYLHSTMCNLRQWTKHRRRGYFCKYSNFRSRTIKIHHNKRNCHKKIGNPPEVQRNRLEIQCHPNQANQYLQSFDMSWRKIEWVPQQASQTVPLSVLQFIGMARNIIAVISHTVHIQYRAISNIDVNIEWVPQMGVMSGAVNENSEINILLLHARERSKGGHIKRQGTGSINLQTLPYVLWRRRRKG